MRGDFIALDIETTGLNIDEDAIIEIGAVRLRDGVIVAEFGTLVNPGFMIPAETTRITGIYPEDVRSAPTLKTALPQFNEFAGDALLIAHNASFDLNFLRRFGSIKTNRSLDTLELASVLLPHIPRYNLGALTKLMNIPLENAHRALDDARATGLLYWELWKKALELPYALVAEICEDARPLNWEALPFFEAVLQEKSSEATTVPYEVRLIAPATVDNPPPPASFTGGTPAEIFAADGPLARTLPNYEIRPQQVQMAEAVQEAFQSSQHLLVEAGTGTGKSLAYLIPALQWAAQTGNRVVISTNTTNLQEQLLHKDVPLLQRACNAEGVQVALLKGRDNYLCLRRLEALRRRRPNQVDELRLMAKILIWTFLGASGDRAEINLRFGESHLWSRLSARDECTPTRCGVGPNPCPFYRARKQAEEASVLIVNHALLISDANSENRVLPDYRYLIVDEAHQLEDAITQGMSLRIDAAGVQRRLLDLGGLTSGILGDLLINLRGRISDKQYLKLETFITDLSAAIRGMKTPVKLFFGKVQEFCQDQGSHESIRIDADTRRKGPFAAIDAAWGDLAEYLEVVADSLGQLRGAISRFADQNIPYYDDHTNSIQTASAYFTDVLQTLRAFVQRPDPNTIYWIAPNYVPENVSIQTAPLHIGPLVESHLWRGKESVVLTSATLTTAASFDFIQERLFADTIKTLAVGSPFDYKSSTLIYIPEDVPEPNKTGYQKAVEQGIIELAAALNGRVLALFTSYSQLRETAVNIAPRLALGGITVYDQATGGSRETLLDSFKSSEKAVLLGTRSFWEGVDIPGEDLSALVIVRLPFAVPNEPIFAARADQYNDAFKQYAIPDAILRFRQGFGRLIRTQQDRGVVAVLDSRIVNKSYGLTFLESLPDCTIKYGPLSEIANNAKQWLA